MKIEIRRKQPKPIELVFEKRKINGKPFLVIKDVDSKYVNSHLRLRQGFTRVPSTLLSRWVNVNLHSDLLELSDRCNTVERVKDGRGGRYYFTNKEDSIFGLHKVKAKTKDGWLRAISIDDNIGMTNVVAILKYLGYNTKVTYDEDKGIVVKIVLTKEEV